MGGVIYVDILFFINGLIGYFLLRGAALLAGRVAADWRIFLGAAAAGAASFLLLLPPLPGWLMWGAKLGSAVLIVFVSFPIQSMRVFWRCCFWYVFLNIAFSGLVLAALYHGGLQGVMMNNLAVYFHVSPLLLIGCILLMYLAVQGVSLLFGHPGSAKTVPFTACFAGGSVAGLALVDTGFSVRDPITGAGAFLLSWPAVKEKLPGPLRRSLALYFEEGAIETGGTALRLIPTQTATGTRALPAVAVGELTVETNRQKRRYTRLCAVFTPEMLADGSFCAILSAEDL